MAGEFRGAGSPASPTDDELLRAVRQGESAALEVLLRRYQPHLYRFGLRMCGNEEDADDVAQESLVAMARSIGDFRGDSSVSTWLFTIARRLCMKQRRRSTFAPSANTSIDGAGAQEAERLVDPGPTPEQAATNRQIEAALRRAIGALDAGQREVLVLRDVEGLSAAEVAGIVGISVDAVKSRLHRARMSVRRALAPALGSATADEAPGPACPDTLMLFSRHLEGEIDRETCASMEAHLAQCRRCRTACESLKRSLAICREAPLPELPEATAAQVKKAIRSFLDHR